MRRKCNVRCAEFTGHGVIFLTVRRNAIFNFQIVNVNKRRRAKPGGAEIPPYVGNLFCALDHARNHGRFCRRVEKYAMRPSVDFLVLLVRG